MQSSYFMAWISWKIPVRSCSNKMRSEMRFFFIFRLFWADVPRNRTKEQPVNPEPERHLIVSVRPTVSGIILPRLLKYQKKKSAPRAILRAFQFFKFLQRGHCRPDAKLLVVRGQNRINLVGLIDEGLFAHFHGPF